MEQHNLDVFTIDDDDTHDQLPSVEEAKLTSSRNNLRSSNNSSSGRRRKLTVCIVLTVLVVLVIGIAVGFTRRNNEKQQASRLSEVIAFLQSNDLSNAGDLAKENSPQRKAAEFIADQDAYNVAITASTTFVQRYTLAVLFFAFQGESWPPGLGWLADTSVCDWHNNDQFGDFFGTRCNDAGELSEIILCKHATKFRSVVFFAVRATNVGLSSLF
jgi:hypothetical protein